MELRHLRYFIAVSEELSLGRAAHRLHVSQPALSQQIRDLENEPGLKLFTRNSRGVQLTEAGRAFLIGGRRALAATKLAAEQAQESRERREGTARHRQCRCGDHRIFAGRFVPVS